MSVARELADLPSASPSTDANFDNGTFVIDVSTDRVGIGTTAPATQLEIVSDVSGGAPQLDFKRADNGDSNSLKLITGSTADWIIGERNDSTSNFHIYSYGTGTDVFSVLRATGKVGIGIITPVTKLTVEGTLTLKEQAAADGDTAAYGQIWVKNTAPNSLYFTGDTGIDQALASTGKAIAMAMIFGG